MTTFRSFLKQFDRAVTRALPYAMRDALNSMAFEARAEWQREIEQSFTLRNKFTRGSIRVDRVPLAVRSAHEMHSVVGSVAPYMSTQEEGDTLRAKGGRSKAIPAGPSAGQGPTARRTKRVRQANHLKVLEPLERIKSVKGRRRQNAVTLAVAKRLGYTHVILNRSKGGRGLFSVRFGARKASTRMLYDLSRGSVKIAPEPTMSRAVARVDKRISRIAKQALLRQYARHRVFGVRALGRISLVGAK